MRFRKLKAQARERERDVLKIVERGSDRESDKSNDRWPLAPASADQIG